MRKPQTPRKNRLSLTPDAHQGVTLVLSKVPGVTQVTAETLILTKKNLQEHLAAASWATETQKQELLWTGLVGGVLTQHHTSGAAASPAGVTSALYVLLCPQQARA